MKNHRSRCYLAILLLINLTAGTFVLHAQNNIIEHYLKETKGYAAIYRGKMEHFYSSSIYENQPYYISDEFVDATVIYNKREYCNQKIRFDTYMGHFLILSPDGYSIILDKKKVEKVQFHNREIISYTPPADSGLKEDYYLSLFEGNQLLLLGREKASVRVLSSKIEFTFDKHTRYYLIRNGQCHQVKNRKSFTKLFPEFKKQIKAFAKENQLNFKEDREYSLAALGRHCNELLNIQKH